MQKFTPLADRVLIEPIPVADEVVTESGIIAQINTSQVASTPVMGYVVATGKGRRTMQGDLIPLDVEIGQKVTWSKFAGTILKMNGKELVLMRESDIAGIIEE